MADNNQNTIFDDPEYSGPYHNTTPLSGDELKEAIETAKSQYRDTRKYFIDNPQDDRITPERVFLYLLTIYPGRYKKSKMESIRRSFSDLKRNKVIEKSGWKAKGNYGRPVNCWKLNPDFDTKSVK